jgi:small-conductance mechanosensitive channel
MVSESTAISNFIVAWDHKTLQTRVFSSAVLFLAIMAVRYFGMRTLRGIPFESHELRRRWIVQLKNGVFIVLVGGLVAVWAQELRSFALGLAAIAVALVVATREFILCFVGGILKTTTRPFDIGDRVEVGAFRGDVIDHNFLTTTLQEVGPDSGSQQYSGRNTVLPNSHFLSHAITVEKLSKPFIIHTFRVVVKSSENWAAHQEALMSSVRKHSLPYMEQAKAYLAQRCQREGIELPSSDPRISVDLSHMEYIGFNIRLAVPSRSRARVEQGILQDYLSLVCSRESTGTEKSHLSRVSAFK